MSLHDRIMSMPSGEECPEDMPARMLYKIGHRDARHSAAEIATNADELINWLEAHLETLRQLSDTAASFDEANIAINRIRQFREDKQ